MQTPRVILSGSHAGSTAFSVIEEIRRRNLDWEIYWVGRKWATEHKDSFTLEYNTFPGLGVKFYNLESGKIQTKFTRHTIPALFSIPLGFIKSLQILLSIKPDVVVTFGGATGASVSFWSWFLKIPVIVHEQTSVAGRANIFSSKFAKAVAISRLSSKKYFHNKNVVLTGNPINPEITKFASKNESKIVNTIFIAGGSRGSVVINEAFRPIIPSLIQHFNIIHQTGIANEESFDKGNLKHKVFGQINPQEWIKELSKADIVISRAGANVVSELIYLKKPSILIPIPWSYKDEQTENAKYMVDLGLARILPQDELTPERLEKEIDSLVKDFPDIIKGVKKIPNVDENASKKLVSLIESYI